MKSHLPCTINTVIVKYEPMNITFVLIQSRNAQIHFVPLKMSPIYRTDEGLPVFGMHVCEVLFIAKNRFIWKYQFNMYMHANKK